MNYLVMKSRRCFFYLIFFFLSFNLYSNYTEYYESNEFGVALRELYSSQIDEFDYILILENRGAVEIRRLLKKGKELMRWERKNRFSGTYVETKYSKDKIESVVHYSGGKLIKEELYFDGELSSIREYMYSSGNLREIKVYDENNKILYVNRYTKDSRGRLSTVARYEQDFQENLVQVATTSFEYSDYYITMQIYIEGNIISRYIYDKGRLKQIIQQEGEEEVYNKIFPLDKQKSATESDQKSGIDIERFYDSDKRIIKEVSKSSDGSKKIVNYKYDDEGNIIEMRIRSAGKRELYNYEYNKDNEKTREEYYLNRDLIYKREYSSLRRYEETVYRKGIVIYRGIFEDGALIEDLTFGGGGAEVPDIPEEENNQDSEAETSTDSSSE